MAEKKVMLPLEAIEFSVLEQHNPRAFDEEHAVKLARSMNDVGIRTPIVVYPAEVMTESGVLVFEEFATESAYVAATGWHRQWGLRLTAEALVARDIEPDILPVSEVPCEVVRGTFSEFWAKLFTDNTQFVPGMNPGMGKMPTKDEIRRIFENLCLLPNYLQLSTSALAMIFKMAQATANAWREKVIAGIYDVENPYQLTETYREELKTVIESGERIGLDGKRRKATQEKRASASPAAAPEPAAAPLNAADETAIVRAATLTLLGEVNTAFAAHQVSDLMDFETFCDECSHQFMQTPNVLQALVHESREPNAPDSEANAIARELSPKALGEWERILSAICTALQTNAGWVEALCVNPLDEAVADFKGGYARLTEQVSQAVHRWHPSLPVPEIQALLDTLIIDIGCQSVYGAMADADARAALGETATSQFREGTATLREYSECFQNDKQVIQKPAADVLRQTVLKSQRKLKVLKRFSVTEFSALGSAMQEQIHRPDPGAAESVEERLDTFFQWQLGMDAACTLERAARLQVYRAAYDKFAAVYHGESTQRRRFIEEFTPSLSDKPEDARPLPTFEQVLQAAQAMAEVSFSERVPKETDDPGFYPKLEKTAQVFDMFAEIATETDADARETLFITPVWDVSSFVTALEALSSEEGLLQELNEKFQAGDSRVMRNEITSDSPEAYTWQRTYLLSRAEIDEVVEDFYHEVIEPQTVHADAVAAHEAAYDAARDAALAGIGEFPSAVTWHDVLNTAGEHLDSQLSGGMPRSPDADATDTRAVRHRTHLLHQVKKGVEQGTAWFQHLLKSKAPAPAPTPEHQPEPAAKPHYADPRDADSLSFEELCCAIEEELDILIETYPGELAAHRITLEQVNDFKELLSEVTMTL